MLILGTLLTLFPIWISLMTSLLSLKNVNSILTKLELTKCCDLVNLYSIFKPCPVILFNKVVFFNGTYDVDTSRTLSVIVELIGVRKPPKLGVITGVIGTTKKH